MGRAPCCDKANVKKGPWSPEEDAKLKDFIHKFGTAGNWIALPQKAGLKRCGKSCRLRWLNYLRPNIKHGEFTDEEDRIICTLYATIGSRWSIIAAQLPGRTDNDIKNYWNTKLKKKLSGLINNNNNNNNNNNPLNQTKFSPLFSTVLSQYSQPPFNTQANIHDFISAPQNYVNFNLNNYPSFNPYNNNNNMLVFGGNDQASCSSSDGTSCSQISYGKNDHHEEMGILINPNIGLIEENNKFMLQNYGDQQHELSGFVDNQKINNGFLGNSQLEYDLEEVKQLISCNNGNNSLLFNDENKTSVDRGSIYYF